MSNYLPRCRAWLASVGDQGLPLRFMLKRWNWWRVASGYGKVAPVVPRCSVCYRPLRRFMTKVKERTEACLPDPVFDRIDQGRFAVWTMRRPVEFRCHLEVMHP